MSYAINNISSIRQRLVGTVAFSIFDIPQLSEDDSDQEDFSYATAGSTLSGRLVLPPDSHLYVTTNDGCKWLKGKPFHTYAENALAAGSRITLYVQDIGTKVSDAIRSLGQNRKGTISLVRCGNLIGSQHWAMVDKPRQLWYEAFHRGPIALGCAYTNNPSIKAYDEVKRYFSWLDSKGEKKALESIH